jgi:dynein heavy chain
MPELEKQRADLIVAISKDQKQLAQLMAKILQLLFTSKGNILDNETLINTLNNAKKTATQVSERLIQSQETEKEIAEKREVYRPVSTRGSVLYFVVIELPGIDSMYQYSLEFFTRIFNGVLDSTEPNDDVKVKCQAFIEKTTYAVYANVSRGLFANHREVFSFLIATWLLRSTGAIPESLWRIFVRGPKDVDLDKYGSPNEKIEPRIWAKACALSAAVKEFLPLPNVFSEQYDDWIPFVSGQSTDIPKPFDKVSTFLKLIAASCISRRKVVSIARQLVIEVLGEKFVTQTSVDLNEPFAEISNDTLFLFIFS